MTTVLYTIASLAVMIAPFVFIYWRLHPEKKNAMDASHRWLVLLVYIATYVFAFVACYAAFLHMLDFFPDSWSASGELGENWRVKEVFASILGLIIPTAMIKVFDQSEDQPKQSQTPDKDDSKTE